MIIDDDCTNECQRKIPLPFIVTKILFSNISAANSCQVRLISFIAFFIVNIFGGLNRILELGASQIEGAVDFKVPNDARNVTLRDNLSTEG